MTPSPGGFLGFACIQGFLGIGALMLGVRDASLGLGGLGLLSLFQVPLALVVRHRLEGGLGNRGLDAERRALRWVGHLLNPAGLLLLGLGLAALAGRRSPDPGFVGLLLSGGVLVSALVLGGARGDGQEHPTLVQARNRARMLALAASVALAGGLLGFRFPWADAAAGLALSLIAFVEGRRLRAAVALKASCGGCGSCGCG